MFIRLLYKDTNFHIYKIDENGTIKKNDEVLSPDDIIYHSTNGYDYVLLEKFDGTLTMYPLDKVVYNSFYPEIMNLGNHLKCIHLNGDLRDNRLDNLEGVKEEEEWRMITYPRLPKDTYMVSSFGNVMNIKTKKLVGCKTGHDENYMELNHNNHHYQIHRLVTYEFISHDMFGDKINMINHIDNDGFNNCVDNLEIVTNKQNCDHAIMIGVTKGMIRTEEIVETFCRLYVKNKGDIKKTKYDIKQLNLDQYFGNRFITNLIRKRMWCDITDKYFKLGEYELPYKEQLTDDEIHAICRAIVECGGSPTAALNELHTTGYDRIMINDVKHVRYKTQFADISDQYFNKDQFEVNHKSYLTTDEVIDICLRLIEFEFCSYDVLMYYRNSGNDRITKEDISGIKHKYAHVKISDKYFLKNGPNDFNVLRHNK